MDWIASLLGFLCPFCQTPNSTGSQCCTQCAPKLIELEQEPVVFQSLNALSIRAAFHYEGWARDLILTQKQRPSRMAIRWLAKTLNEKTPQIWRDLPLIWVPGSLFSDAHLVEELAIELKKCGFHFPNHAKLFRSLRHQKAQKQLNVLDRKNRDLSRSYFHKSTETIPLLERPKAILLDDVVTTGSTIAACQRLISPSYEVVGAIALAYTPLNKA